jgi:hypothetical protein
MQLDLKRIDWPSHMPQGVEFGQGILVPAGAKLRDGQPLKPGNYVTADNKISMCSEPVRTRWRGCEVVHCATTGWQQRATRSGHVGRYPLGSAAAAETAE